MMDTEIYYHYLDQITPYFRKILPPVYFLFALILMFLLSYFMPISLLIYIPLRVFGVILAIGGIVLCSLAAMEFKKADNPIKPFEQSIKLVQTGPFRYSRNPMYLGLNIALVGVWIALGTFSPFLVIPFFFFIIQEAFIREEERILLETFPDEYRDYCDTVSRWLWFRSDPH